MTRPAPAPTAPLTGQPPSPPPPPPPPPADLRLLLAAVVAWASLALSLGLTTTVRAVLVGSIVCATATAAVAWGAHRRPRHSPPRRSPTRRPPTHPSPTRRTSARRPRPPAHARRGSGPPVTGLLAAAIMLLQVATLGHQALRDVGPLRELSEQRAVVTLTGTVATDPRPIANRHGQEVFLVRLDPDRVQGRGRDSPAYGPVVLCGDASLRDLRWGATVSVTGRLSTTDPADSEMAALQVRGEAATLEAPGVVARGAEHLRAGLRASVASLPADARGLVPGLVIGDTSQLPPTLDDAMRATGMTHLTAVSGSNVAVVLALVLGLCRLTGIPRRLRPWLALAMLAGFVVLARPEPSVLRAATMGAIGVIGLATNRHSAGLPLLGGAVLAVLTVDPWLARSYGFALSTLATVGLLIFAGPWGEHVGRSLRRLTQCLALGLAARAARGALGAGPSRALARWALRIPERTRTGTPTWSLLGTALALPVAAQVVCAPVIVLLQSSVSVVGVLANLLAAPLVPMTTIGGVAVAGLALVWPGGAQWLAWVPGVPALGIARIGRTLADVPFGSIPWPDGAPGALSLAALTVVILLLGRSVVALAGRRPLATLAALLLALSVLTPTRVLTWPPPGWQLVSCDVGQGDATVLRSGPERAVVVDAGPDPDAIDRCLDRLDIAIVDAVVLTHFHQDHAGGLEGVSRGRAVRRLLTTWVPEPEEVVRAVDRWAKDQGIPISELHVGDTLRFGTLSAQVWWPERRIAAGSVPNNASVVLAAEVGGVRALLLGDLEREACAALLSRLRRDPEMAATAATFDVIKSPHHGSANIDPDLLAAVRAPVAIVSVGADNDYGHPAPSHLRILTELGYAVRRTDLAGTVAVVHTGQMTRVITER